MSDKIVEFSDFKDMNEAVRECKLFKDLYYDLAHAVEAAVECDTKHESDRLLVNAQRLAEYKYLSYYEKDIESVEIFLAGFNVDEYLDNIKKQKKNDK